MKVTFTDSGETINVQSHKEVVDYMRMTSKVHYDDNTSFMRAFSFRAVQWNNLDIRSTNEEDFVNGLLENKLVTISK